MKPITNIDDPRYVKAMSHPLRVRILAMLDERTASPVELAGWLRASLGTVAYHVRTLERIERNPHSGDTKDVALVMMLFEAARLAVETEGDPVAERRRRHRRPVTPELAD